jgi:hypothetical protein
MAAAACAPELITRSGDASPTTCYVVGGRLVSSQRQSMVVRIERRLPQAPSPVRGENDGARYHRAPDPGLF